MALSLKTVEEIFNSLSTEDKDKFVTIVNKYKKSRENETKKIIKSKVKLKITFDEAVEYLLNNQLKKRS
ncbi:hypothetical protein [Flavobacterium sp.]|jgi:hypothetical protein|uniref:hypothetical protein n=1 Tax=Flavobacterium sp. TaxID=239 RepID=UPI002A8265D2|nr:hypothetical protein [Flavobacterium sp.]